MVLISFTVHKLSSKERLRSWDLNPGLLGEKRKCYLFAMPPSQAVKSLRSLHYSISSLSGLKLNISERKRNRSGSRIRTHDLSARRNHDKSQDHFDSTGCIHLSSIFSHNYLLYQSSKLKLVHSAFALFL